MKNLAARGGTAIQSALELSLDHLKADDERLKMIVFATDGLPTIGERNPTAILRAIAKKNQQDVRIFVFGEGFDVNTKLLDFLALDHRGEADYILPKENITQKISRFFDRVGSPIMTDLQVSFDGLQVQDVFPRKIPDVFRGEQVILYGRYNGHGKKTVRITGNVGGTKKDAWSTRSTSPSTQPTTPAASSPACGPARRSTSCSTRSEKANPPNRTRNWSTRSRTSQNATASSPPTPVS